MWSGERIYRSSVGVKAWQPAMPTVSAVRPARCGGASCPAGRNLVVHGDGTRERQVWGPEAAEAPPEDDDGAGTALPMPALRHLHAGRALRGPAAAAVHRPGDRVGVGALGAARSDAARVRARVSPFVVIGPAAAGRWTTLRRWARETIGGRLFVERASPENFTLWMAAPNVSVGSSTSRPSIRTSSIEGRSACSRAPLRSVRADGARRCPGVAARAV